MEPLVQLLDHKLRQWRPETSSEVRARVAEIIDHADQGELDLTRSRAVEQEVLDLIDEPSSQ